MLEKNCNGGTVAFVAVRGNLSVAANDVTIISAIVFGNLSVTGHGVGVVNVGVQGSATFADTAALCDSNYAFTDANKDWTIQVAEKGAALTCAPK